LDSLLTDLPRTLSTGGGDARRTRARPKVRNLKPFYKEPCVVSKIK
jgi:hypothetical protein